MDPDDYYPSTTVLESMYRAAVQNNALIVGGSWSEDRFGRIKTNFKGIYNKFVFSSDGFIKYKDYQFDFGFHRFIYRRKLIVGNEICFPPYKRFQDPPFFVKAMLAASEFYAIKEQTYRYRTGHQMVNWDDVAVCKDLLKGLIDDLCLSSDNNLAILHNITLNKINTIYSRHIIKTVKNNPEDTELLELLSLVDKTVNRKLLSTINPAITDDYQVPTLVKAAKPKTIIDSIDVRGKAAHVIEWAMNRGHHK